MFIYILCFLWLLLIIDVSVLLLCWSVENLLRKVSVLLCELVIKLLVNLRSVENKEKSQQCRDSENSGVQVGEINRVTLKVPAEMFVCC